MAEVRCLNDAHGEGWAMYHGDCVSVVEQLPQNSIDMAVYSPPFSGLYIYNDSVADMGNCADQDEVDYYWEKLTEDGGQEVQCGWLKDKFGVSWQISPALLDEMMSSGDQEKINRVTKAFLQMKKFDLAKLQEAAEGK